MSVPVSLRRLIVPGSLPLVLLVSACAEAPADQPAAAPPTAAEATLDVVPLVGHWETSVEDGELVVTADATRWDGAPPADAGQYANRLFGSLTQAFEANVMASAAFPLAIDASIDTFTSGSASVEFRLIGGETDQIAGLVFDLKPNGEYHYVRYNTRDDNVALWRFRNGERERIADGEATRRLDLGSWYTLGLTIDGQTLTAVAAGDLEVTYELEVPVSGRVGFWTKRDSITAFRNLRIE